MELKEGDLVADRYAVERRLDARSGLVYLAFDKGASRSVVLKFLRTGALAAQNRVRFERELEIVANLRHPHTVRLFSHHEHKGVPFIVFEHVPGEDLSELILRGPWSVQIARRVLAQLLGALDEAHKQGVIHRDVCSQNVRVFEHLTEAWNIKLLGFGFGRPVASSGASVTVTATGEVLGVSRYLAPEALRGEPLTPSSDLYGVGIIMLELLLGPDALGPGTDPAAQTALSAAIDRVPPPLGPVLRRMLSPDPSRRFATASAVEAALTDVVEPARPTTQPARRAGRSPLVLAVAAIVGLLVGAAILVATPDDEPPPPPPRNKPVPGILKTAAPPAPQPPPVVLERHDLGAPVSDTGCGQPPPFIGLGRFPGVGDGWPALVPSSYEQNNTHALVVLLHGYQQSAADLLEHGGFVAQAEKHGFVVIAIEDDLLNAWKDDEVDRERIWQSLEETQRRLCIDDRRVFFVGHSQGGHILDVMMCDDRVRGVAFHSYRGAAAGERCLERSVPLILFNPTESGHVPYDGGLNCTRQEKASVAEVERMQRRRNHCKRTPTSVFESDDGRCVKWDCETPFRSCAIEGGHGWPNVPVTSWMKALPMDLDPCRGPDAAPFPIAEQTWDFFSRIED